MHELITVLTRIADALEQENQQTAMWIALQEHWREQGDPNALRILAVHEEQAAKDQAWRDMHTKAFERFLEEQRAIIRKGLAARADEE